MNFMQRNHRTAVLGLVLLLAAACSAPEPSPPPKAPDYVDPVTGMEFVLV